MRKYHLFQEAAIAALVIMLLTFIVSFLPFKFEFTKAIRQEFLGFDVYDLHFSENHLRTDTIHREIVIVQVGDTRREIADQLERISKYNPKVIGVDVLFDSARAAGEEAMDEFGNTSLQMVLANNKNIVLANRILKGEHDDSATELRNFFDDSVSRPVGFINFTGDNEYVVIRSFSPFYPVSHPRHEAFAVAISHIFYPEGYAQLKERGKEDEIINYSGNLDNYLSITRDELEDFDKTGQLSAIIKDKIVLLGYFEKSKTPVLNDLRFTPLNERTVGKSYPDMYGVVIHANILSMILSGKYATLVSDFVSYLIAYVVVFFMLLFILMQYKSRGHPHHGLLLLLQLVAIIVLLYLFVVLFDLTLIKVPLVPLMVGLVLSVEAFGIYEWLAGWLHKKFRYPTLFSKKSHV